MTSGTPLDVERARQETPGCATVVHLNNAGAALMPDPVLRAVSEHLRLEAEIGGYEAAAKVQSRLDHVYDAAAQLLSCSSREIAILENATRAWDMAFYAVPLAVGDRVLTSVAEYASNYIALLQRSFATGADIVVVPNDEFGQFSVDSLKEMIDERVKLVAVNHVPTNSGLVNPAELIGEVAAEAGVLYLLDACQSVGQMPIDVGRIRCSFLSTTGRKFLRGPRGTGLLFVREELIERLEPPFLDFHAATWVDTNRYHIRADARRFESWERNCAATLGLAAGIDYALGWGIESIWSRVADLAEQLRTDLAAIPGVEIHDPGLQRCAIVTFTADGILPAEIKLKLSDQHINVWSAQKVSARLDMEHRALDEVVRASPHYYNTESELGELVDAVAAMISG